MKPKRYQPKTIIQPWRGECAWAIYTLCVFVFTNFVVGVFPNIAQSLLMLIGFWILYLVWVFFVAGCIYYYYQVYQAQLELKKPRPRHYRPDPYYYYDS